VVDDDDISSSLADKMLHALGYGAEFCKNGLEAVEVFAPGKFSAILMDMQMPVMDGISATAWLRKAGYGGPIVAITANAMKEDRERCLQAGCDDFLTKPIDTGAFHGLLARFLAAPEPAEASPPPAASASVEDEFERLVADFTHGLPARLQGMQHALATGEWEQLRTAAHQLKGIAGNCHCPEMTEPAARLEREAKAHNAADASALLANLASLASAAVARWQAQHTQPAGIVRVAGIVG
jgi:CheY-like chemotaxis protein